MRDKPPSKSNRQGFTLMEVIVTIMAAGILAAFFVHFMGTAMSQASNSMERVQAESAGASTVETIIADYVTAMNTDPGTALASIVTDITNNIYDSTPAGITVSSTYITFDTGGNVVPDANPTDTLQITARLEVGNDLVFLLGQSRTAAGQPLIRY